MGSYGLRFRPAGAFGEHVHPQRFALYQSGTEGGRDLLAAWERFWGVGLRCGVKFPVVLPRRAAPCSVTGTGAAGCCRIHTSKASLPAAPCAPLCGARGAAPVLRTPPLLREPRPFFWAAFLSLRRLRCGKKSRGPGLLTAAFVNLNAVPLEKIRVPGFFSGYFSLPAAIRRERKVPAAPRGSRDNAANRAA